MPLPRHDEQPLPSRRALRQAERERAAASSVPPAAQVPPAAPVGSREVHEAPAPVRAAVSAWRRVPQLVVVGSLVAAAAGYTAIGDTTAATAGSVPEFVREETVVSAEDAAIAAVVPEETPSDLVAGEDGLLRVREEDQASRAERSVLPGCDGVPPEVEVDNGRMDEQFLCTLWDGRTEIRADAAVSLALLNQAYRAELGTDMCLTDGYRSYEAQVSVRNRKPGLAARPGTSEHGYGLAVDLCGGVESAGPPYVWLRENAGQFGFENPAWAQKGGGGPYEPWHWEYTAGQW